MRSIWSRLAPLDKSLRVKVRQTEPPSFDVYRYKREGAKRTHALFNPDITEMTFKHKRTEHILECFHSLGRNILTPPAGAETRAQNEDVPIRLTDFQSAHPLYCTHSLKPSSISRTTVDLHKDSFRNNCKVLTGVVGSFSELSLSYLQPSQRSIWANGFKLALLMGCPHWNCCKSAKVFLFKTSLSNKKMKGKITSVSLEEDFFPFLRAL